MRAVRITTKMVSIEEGGHLCPGVWEKGQARNVGGICALSGQKIHKGDEVYRPVTRVPMLRWQRVLAAPLEKQV